MLKILRNGRSGIDSGARTQNQSVGGSGSTQRPPGSQRPRPFSWLLVAPGHPWRPLARGCITRSLRPHPHGHLSVSRGLPSVPFSCRDSHGIGARPHFGILTLTTSAKTLFQIRSHLWVLVDMCFGSHYTTCESFQGGKTRQQEGGGGFGGTGRGWGVGRREPKGSLVPGVVLEAPGGRSKPVSGCLGTRRGEVKRARGQHAPPRPPGGRHPSHGDSSDLRPGDRRAHPRAGRGARFPPGSRAGAYHASPADTDRGKDRSVILDNPGCSGADVLAAGPPFCWRHGKNRSLSSGLRMPG